MVQRLCQTYQHQQTSQPAYKAEKYVSTLSCSANWSVTGDLQPWVTSPSSISSRITAGRKQAPALCKILLLFLLRPLWFALLLPSLFKTLLSEKDMRKISRATCLGLHKALRIQAYEGRGSGSKELFRFPLDLLSPWVVLKLHFQGFTKSFRFFW